MKFLINTTRSLTTLRKNKGGFYINIDFTKLNSLATQDKGQEWPQEAPKMALEQAGDNEGENVKAKAENSPGGQNEGGLKAGNLQRRADAYKTTVERAAAAYKQYQRNILAAGQIRAEISNGTRQGEDIYSLFLKAARAISYMTDDKVFLKETEANLKAVYGAGLGEPYPLSLEIMETKARLKNLRAARKRETQPDSLDRIGKAIEAHEARIKQLERQAKKAEERPA